MNELPTSNIQDQNNNQINENKSQKPKIYDIRERLFLFSRRILQICRNLPNSAECEVIKKQLSKAGTSIGANFEEADGALTKRDFVNKVAIARKEAKETKYWLRIVNDVSVYRVNLTDDNREAEEIICILSSILKKCGHKFRI
ncbi:MAG: four helix bundle protein [Candidatus Margulisbacteria bacterium]|nr:four helix bundle protein [Candidatus Margulisiibacteriota bacterium]